MTKPQKKPDPLLELMWKNYEIVSKMPPIRYEVNSKFGRRITILEKEETQDG